MEAHLLKSLKKIKLVAPKKLKDIRTLCDEHIEILTKNLESTAPRTPANDADRYWDVFEMCCMSRQPRVIEASLHSVHFLIEHRFLRGTRRVEPIDGSGERRTLMDDIIRTVCDCSQEQDEGVELQIVKVLLTAVTSVHCEVHEAALLSAVKACFHIHLTSRDPNNKLAAKAALTQMLSLVFQRMERFDEQSKKEIEEYLQFMSNHASESRQRSNGPGPCGQNMYQATFDALGYIAKGDYPATLSLTQDDTGETSTRAFASILHKDAFLVFRALCRLSRNPMQDDGDASSDPVALRNKILALELLLHILEHAGPAFCSGDKFIQVIRGSLCVSLLENCTSNIQEVVGLSLRIFVVLTKHFKVHLKSEIEVFVTNVFLKILESENSSFDHKARVLEVFDLMCQDQHALFEFFVNYDCDFEAIDLYKGIIDALSRIAKGRSNPDGTIPTKKAAHEELLTQAKALEGLIHTLGSLIKLAGLDASAVALSPPTSGGRASDSGNGHLNGSRGEIESTQLGSEGDEKGGDDNGSVQSSSVHDVDTLDISSVQAASESDSKEDRPSMSVKQSFTRKQKVQEEIELGILKFNLSPKKGLAYLAAQGHLELTPKSVAKFLHQYKDKLDKTVVGDYISKEREYDNGFCVKVLHEYVDMMEFTDMKFDEGLRSFLSGFRLPGEAQKIDRVMEKFAERFCSQNKAVFPSADMAFILAFSTIMLQTDLHNPAIREDRKITKEGFIRNNKGISSEGDLPDEFLADIYDRIAQTPISLKEDEDLRSKMLRREDSSIFSGLGTDRRKKEAYSRERKDMVRAGEALFRQKASQQVTFVRTRYIDNGDVQAMFDIAWPPMTSVFSQVLELNDDEPLVQLCLEGFRLSIKMAAQMNIKTARDTFINSIVKFTTLDTVREMKPKNIHCIKLLLTIAVDEGSYLNESWGPVLECISQVARLQLLAHGLHTDDMFFSSQTPAGLQKRRSGLALNKRERRSSRPSTVAQDPITKLLNPPTKADLARAVEERNAELLIEEIDHVTIDRIFARSVQLSSEAIQHFVTQLCEVSKAEVTNASTIANFRGREVTGDISHPRVFSLQKLVEVADYNMTARPRVVWANIWKDLARHFSTVGIHENSALAMYAIDSLRQLSIKFLHKDELRDFSFQRFFLKPFEVIMSTSRSAEIKELVLRCLDNMILARASNIRSGWKSIFAVYSTAAADENRSIAQLAFETVERLVTQSFELLVFDFVEVVNCLVAFVAGPHLPLSWKGLKYLQVCADHLAAGTITPALEKVLNVLNDADHPLLYEDNSVFKLWWPLLLGLAARVSDARHDVRLRALEVLKGVLVDHGAQFSKQTWEVIFKGILFPIMDNAKTDRCPQVYSNYPTERPRELTLEMAHSSWIVSTAPLAFACILSLFFTFYPLLQDMLEDLMVLLEGCICQEIESLARIALQALGELVTKLDANLPERSWDVVVDQLVNCATRCLTVRFSNIGQIHWDEYVSDDLVQLVHRRKHHTSGIRSKSGDTMSEHAISAVTTAFGPGRVVEANSQEQLVVQLAWGATLYTRPDQVTFDVELDSDDDDIFGEQDRDWEVARKGTMTGIVCALGLVTMIGDLFQTRFALLSVKHMTQLCCTLELCYQYARCFNRDPALRMTLHSHGFMRFPNQPLKLPHLLEFETESLSQLFTCLFKHYQATCGASVINDLQRLLSLSTYEYVAINYTVDRPSIDSDARVFATQYLQVYGPVLLISLQGITAFSHEQFRSNIRWLPALLSDLITCTDVTVRRQLKLVYQTHVDPLLMADTTEESPDVSPAFRLRRKYDHDSAAHEGHLGTTRSA